MRSAARVVLLLLFAAVSALDGGAETVELAIGDEEQYGRYRVVSVPEGFEIRSPSPVRTSRVLAAIGLALLAAAAVLQWRGGPRVVVVATAAAALGAMAGLAFLDRSVLRVTEVSVVHEGFGGRAREWRRDQVAGVAVGWRHGTGPEVKRQIHRVWTVALRGGDPEARLVAYRFEQEPDAQAFAERLAGLLGISVSDVGAR